MSQGARAFLYQSRTAWLRGWFWCGLCFCVFSLSAAQSAPLPQPPVDAPTAHEESPSRFLDRVAHETKARWRQLYRQPQMAPSTDRFRVSYTLGGLIADSYLAMEAGDAQQFKNVNQDIVKYSGALGLAEKLKQRMLTVSKMAETEDWEGVRKQSVENQGAIEKMLVEQRDQDLAQLVCLGMWLRLLEVTSSVIVNDPTVHNKSLAIGSRPFLDELMTRFNRMSEGTRNTESVSMIGNTIDLIQNHWNLTTSPDQGLVELTHEKLNFLNSRMTVR